MRKEVTIIPPSSSYIKLDCPYLKGESNKGYCCLHPVTWLEYGQYNHWLLRCCGDYTELDEDIEPLRKKDKKIKFEQLLEEMKKLI